MRLGESGPGTAKPQNDAADQGSGDPLKLAAPRPSGHVLAVCVSPDWISSFHVLQAAETLSDALAPAGVRVVWIDSSLGRSGVGMGDRTATASESSPMRPEREGGLAMAWLSGLVPGWLRPLVGLSGAPAVVQRGAEGLPADEKAEAAALRLLGCQGPRSGSSAPAWRLFGVAEREFAAPLEAGTVTGEGADGLRAKVRGAMAAAAARAGQGAGGAATRPGSRSPIAPVTVGRSSAVAPWPRPTLGLPLPALDRAFAEAVKAASERAVEAAAAVSRAVAVEAGPALRRAAGRGAAGRGSGGQGGDDDVIVAGCLAAETQPGSLLPPPLTPGGLAGIAAEADAVVAAVTAAGQARRPALLGRHHAVDDVASGFAWLPRDQMRARVAVLEGMARGSDAASVLGSAEEALLGDRGVVARAREEAASERRRGVAGGGDVRSATRRVAGEAAARALGALGGMPLGLGATGRAAAAGYAALADAAVRSGEPEEWLERERRRVARVLGREEGGPGRPAARDVSGAGHSAEAASRVLSERRNRLDSLLSPDRRAQTAEWRAALGAAGEALARNGLVRVREREEASKAAAARLGGVGASGGSGKGGRGGARDEL